MPQKKELIVLPVIGNPYICNDKSGDNFKDIQEVVDGYFEGVDTDRFFIHPMFITEEPRWSAIHTLQQTLKKSQYNIYCNENGINELLCPNYACLYNGSEGLRPMLGVIAITITKKNLEKAGVELPTKGFREDEESEDEEE